MVNDNDYVTIKRLYDSASSPRKIIDWTKFDEEVEEIDLSFKNLTEIHL